MALSFSGTTDRLNTASTPITAYPFTLSAWIKPDVNVSGTILALMDTSAQFDRCLIGHGQGVNVSRASLTLRVNGNPQTIQTTTSLSNGVWGLVTGVFASATDRRIYLNAAGSAQSVTSLTCAAFDRIDIANQNTTNLFDGTIAEVAAWNVALTVDEMTQLSLLFSPKQVRPQSLRFYSKLIGRNSPELDIARGLSLTYTGSPAYADHPRIREAD